MTPLTLEQVRAALREQAEPGQSCDHRNVRVRPLQREGSMTRTETRLDDLVLCQCRDCGHQFTRVEPVNPGMGWREAARLCR